ncbi:DUF1289 domain-containing protein [Taylorella equigenitalis]|uniref:DUF1289 domain-containing protein n=1 Tax=Taylorella equigenitalis TaxID=29575 RepID=UPI00237CAEA7|nr:DUF1289 domain-containing protein [Taylorella equigenitalis]WDU54817.1 DUF1289 domain-containing protein [Taylorella equigenitalis]
MEQEELFDIPSPCINVCQTNNRGYCMGCYRSRDERFHWNRFTNPQKRRVVNLCRGRKLRVIREHLEKQRLTQEQSLLEIDVRGSCASDSQSTQKSQIEMF